MKWLALHIDTSSAGLEPVSNMLDDMGIDGLIIEDEREFREFLEENQQYWDKVDEDLDRSMAGKCRITFYLEENEAAFGRIAGVRMAMADMKAEHPDYAPMLLTMDGVEDADWENNWKAYYKPMEIGERLIVVPEWETADTGDRVALRLDPGLAFGTGSHATTRLCLTGIEKLVHSGMKVLDLGCGSGILSIAAILLGADRAFACDIDPKAVDVAYENAALNGVGRDRYTVQTGDVTGDAALRQAMGSGYELVVANIVSDVIIALAPVARSLMAENGHFLCSGVIDDRAEEVKGKLCEAGFTIEEVNQSEGWFSFLCR